MADTKRAMVVETVDGVFVVASNGDLVPVCSSLALLSQEEVDFTARRLAEVRRLASDSPADLSTAQEPFEEKKEESNALQFDALEREVKEARKSLEEATRRLEETQYLALEPEVFAEVLETAEGVFLLASSGLLIPVCAGQPLPARQRDVDAVAQRLTEARRMAAAKPVGEAVIGNELSEEKEEEFGRLSFGGTLQREAKEARRRLFAEQREEEEAWRRLTAAPTASFTGAGLGLSAGLGIAALPWHWPEASLLSIALTFKIVIDAAKDAFAPQL